MDREIKNRVANLKMNEPLPELIRQRNLGNGRKSKSVIRKRGDEYELFASGAPKKFCDVPQYKRGY